MAYMRKPATPCTSTSSCRCSWARTYPNSVPVPTPLFTQTRYISFRLSLSTRTLIGLFRLFFFALYIFPLLFLRFHRLTLVLSYDLVAFYFSPAFPTISLTPCHSLCCPLSYIHLFLHSCVRVCVSSRLLATVAVPKREIIQARSTPEICSVALSFLTLSRKPPPLLSLSVM